MKRTLWIGIFFVVATLLSSAEYASAQFTLQGNVRDSFGTLVPGIRVSIWDDDPGPDDFLGTTYTSSTGTFSVGINGGWGLEDPDIYVLVNWIFQLTPQSAFPDRHLIMTRDSTANNEFSEVRGCDTDDHDGVSALNCGAINLTDGINPARGSMGRLYLRVNQALQYYENNKGSVGWSADYDVKVAIQTNSVVSFFSQTRQEITISDVDINGVNDASLGQGWQSDIYHEMGHLTHYFQADNTLPPDTIQNRSHSNNSEKNQAFAITEGWASYVANHSDMLPGYAGDGKYAASVDANRRFWRGGSSNDVDGPAERNNGATGREGTDWEQGEDVEGAVSGVFTRLHALYNFSDNLRVMVDDKPNGIYDFCVGYINDAGGVGTAKTKATYTTLQRHGIVYNRARFAVNPFSEEMAPPNDSDAATPGNMIFLDDYTFLRGDVTTKLEAVPKADLGADQSVTNKRVKVGWALALNSLTDEPSSFADFSDWADFTGTTATLELKTSLFGPSNGDGDWDLLAVAENKDEFQDDFLPTWVGDANSQVNTNERYLKTLGSWYDRDRNHQTETIKQGKVIVDNTMPIPVPGSFEPQ